MSVLERCPFYRESNKSKERKGPTIGVRFKEAYVKREIERFDFIHYFSGTVSSLAIPAVEAINI